MARKTLVTGLILCLIILISSIAVLAIPEFNALEGEVLYLSAETFDLDGDLVITTYPNLLILLDVGLLTTRMLAST